MLLSAKAGGVGLNLIGKSVSDAKQCLLNCVDETGATRLVLWEPDWNPSTDEQVRMHEVYVTIEYPVLI